MDGNLLLGLGTMPLRILRFCRNCLSVRQTLSREVCDRCGEQLLPFLDQSGAISRAFLLARGSCCDSGCRNCPYPKHKGSQRQCGCAAITRICPRCGDGFDCQSGNCWCDNIALRPATLKWLGRSYEGCLCPSCLSEFTTDPLSASGG